MKNLRQLSGINSATVASYAEQFIDSPESLTDEWRAFFNGLERDQLAELVGWELVAVLQARARAKRGQSNGRDSEQGWQVAEQIRVEWAVKEIHDAYRRQGHKYASTNPLYRSTVGQLHIDPAAFGLTEADLDRPIPTGALPLPHQAPVKEVIITLEHIYCGGTGYEITHIDDDDERRWLINAVESGEFHADLDSEFRLWILQKLSEASLLEEFIDKKFLKAKRFSIEGAESIIPLLHVLVEEGGDLGVCEVVMGMAHRGRLNVMINLFRQQLKDLFTIFKDGDAKPMLGRGDVKYHLGMSTDVTTKRGHDVHLSLCFNPSHLEFVGPVVLGRVKAKLDRNGDSEGNSCLPILIHGDAAVIGQGIVSETLNLSQLEGYKVGGCVHIVLNNQIGFTTVPSDSRSTRYCTDVSKILGVPVLHVNAEDLNGVVNAARLAIAYRQKFKKDIFIDLVAYRRHGHNEGDEPRFTQPEMYKAIDRKKSIRENYRDHLISTGELTSVKDKEIVSVWTVKMEQSLLESKNNLHPVHPTGTGVWADYTGGRDKDTPEVETGFERDQLQKMIQSMATAPEGFAPHKKLQRFLEQRMKTASTEEIKCDWAIGEALAFATLLNQGFNIRISGQDSQRGTFSHRHAVMHDHRSGDHWNVFDQFGPGELQVWNSPLSEAAVLGFDYGYSLDTPEGLTIWEAQFGDFVNGAQVLLDQFITSGEDKWNRLSGLVLLLPHGFEGQGPEHSSARLERFLQQCAEDNILVCNLTTPAQIFHVLRRQVLRKFRKPLIIMSPKSLLRRKQVVSDIDELVDGKFQKIIGDQSGVSPDKIKRVLLCSGRIYYDLEEERTKREANDVAIIRLEQLYPLSRDVICEALKPYSHADLNWIQDEPWNMGAWFHIQACLRDALGRTHLIRRVSRSDSASPATGSRASHKLEHSLLMDMAFGKLERDAYGAVTNGEI